MGEGAGEGAVFRCVENADSMLFATQNDIRNATSSATLSWDGDVHTVCPHRITNLHPTPPPPSSSTSSPSPSLLPSMVFISTSDEEEEERGKEKEEREEERRDRERDRAVEGEGEGEGERGEGEGVGLGAVSGMIQTWGGGEMTSAERVSWMTWTQCRGISKKRSASRQRREGREEEREEGGERNRWMFSFPAISRV